MLTEQEFFRNLIKRKDHLRPEIAGTATNFVTKIAKNDRLMSCSQCSNFKKNTCGNPPNKGFMGLLKQVLAFVAFFS